MARRTKENRKKLKSFLAIKEFAMMILLILSFIFLALEHFEKLTHEQMLAIEVYEIVIGIIFLSEFLFELHFAKDKRKYWRTHWFYLIAAVPVPTMSFEVLRGVRALRLLKLLKIFAEYRYEHNTRLFVGPTK